MQHTPIKNGFTLVEILIVVIILGILAAIVVPQVSTASNDARAASVRSTLQKIRGQLEVFKLQHAGAPPQTTGMWNLLLSQSSTTETAVAAPSGTNFGPYLQMLPQNPLNELTTISTADPDLAAGWYYTCDSTNFEIRARNKDGSVNFSY